MIRHVAIFTWNEQATDERLSELEAQLGQLPDKVPSLESYTFGRALHLAEGQGDFAVIAATADQQAWKEYVEHPEHVAVVAKYIRPLIATRIVVQI